MAFHLHSSHIKPGDTFICLPGGERYIHEAKANGAKTILELTRPELAVFANQQFKDPSSKLTVIGVTGTNGKTTVTSLITHALNANGFNAACQGTLTGSLTTPESFVSLQNMAKHLASGGTHFVMEVSSHAIHQGRILGIQFAWRLLTNITQDHLDYHGTLEAYKKVKLGFLEADPIHAIYPEQFEAIPLFFNSPLVGSFNVKNMQAAIAVLQKCGLSDPQIATGLSQAPAPPGRFESINQGQPFEVIVDYAHTPDGLEQVLKEARLLATTRNAKVWVVFGCGGNRDTSKRPKMGALAEKYAQHIVLTDDNPRHEDPTQILNDILAGIVQKKQVKVIPDRAKAIETAISEATPGDVVLIAGKGHETYQLVGHQVLAFDDRKSARQALTKRGFQ